MSWFIIKVLLTAVIIVAVSEIGKVNAFIGSIRASISLVSTLTEFLLDAGLPAWRFDIGGILLEKRVFLSHRQNMVHVSLILENKRGELPRLELRPELGFRRQSDAVDKAIPARTAGEESHPLWNEMNGGFAC